MLKAFSFTPPPSDDARRFTRAATLVFIMAILYPVASTTPYFLIFSTPLPPQLPHTQAPGGSSFLVMLWTFIVVEGSIVF